MKRRTFTWLAALMMLLVAAMGSGCQYLLPEEEEPLAPPLVEAKEVTYRTVTAGKVELLEKYETKNARAGAATQASLYFDYSGGRIDEVKVKSGDTVKKGDTLVTLNVGDLKYEIDRAYYALQRARLTVQQIEADPNANAIELEKAKLEEKTCASVYSQLSNKRKNSSLVSPIDGVVTYVTTAKAGEYVEAYTPLVTVADQSQMVLTFEDSTGSNIFKTGMAVELTYKNNTYAGSITSAPFDRPQEVPSNQKGTVFVGCGADLMAVLQPGDEVKVKAVLESRTDVLAVPRNVILTSGTRRFVQIVEDGLKVERDVKVGLETSTYSEILEGLSEGDMVIVH
ncbi:MAG: efflux RND transporter periplasmic adaptor subunit [Eubacteriales bacterium]|nr:efflux RND transporter periplasmic adaptor subunit [Eubacteriales bacterium]